MQKCIVCLWLVWMLSAGQSAAQFMIQGTTDIPKGKVFLITPRAEESWDTLAVGKIEQYQFRLSGIVDEPTLAYIGMTDSFHRVPVLLENASYRVRLSTVADTSDLLEGGGRLQRKLRDIGQKEIPFRKSRDSLYAEYQKCNKQNNLFGKMHIRAELELLDSIRETAENEEIRRNNNLLGCWLIYRRLNTLLRQKTLPDKYALLGDSARQTRLGKEIEKYCREMSRMVIGALAPDFVLETPRGEKLALHAVKAKVKIVDFWASWCAPCRAENPNLRKLYEKYHEQGLEIIGVSLDQQRDAWLKAIEKDGLSWFHLSDLKGWKSPVVRQYGVQGIPHILILDQHNHIVAIKVRGDDLEKRVREMLK